MSAGAGSNELLCQGCSVPWPLTGLEVPEMINHTAVSSLRTHPSQQFEVSVVILPSFRMDMPGADVHGLTYPPGRKVAAIREKIDKEPNFSIVPNHLPFQTSFVVLGDVTFTKKCASGFKDHYDTGNAGAYFTWPGGDACGVCPATGTKIKPDSKTRHLLIVWEMAGIAANGVLCYRVIPRILTREGYEKIMGGPGNHRCTAKDKTFYIPRRQTFDGTLSELCSWGKGAPPAGAAWSQVHSDGTYCAIERWFEDERTLWNPDSGIDTSPCTFMSRSGVDPSTYAEASTSGDSLSMKELKAAIEIAGMSHADCLEKSDLLKRYKEAQDKRTKESWSRGFEPPTSQPIPSTASANKFKPSKAEACNHCGASAKKLLRCARCVTAGRVPAAYCSKECQKLAWPAHKKDVCKPLPQTLCSVCKVARVSTAADAKQNGTLFFCCGAVICYSCSTADDSWTCPCCGKKLPTTDEATLEVLRKAAKRGDSSAQWNLGRAYGTGRFGVKIDHVEAAKWVLKAAEQGHAKAEHAMGVNYRDGEGVAVNNIEARKWFHRAAVQGHVEAQCDLGIMIFYALQRGEEDASLDEAEIWLRKAAAAGDKLAEGTLGTTKMFRLFASQQTGRSWDDINND